ncbi:MAG: hypothetical protein RLZ55_297, partial [Actinomycetota bacterium]
VVLNGWPGSVAATWQRFGRAGRRQQASVGVLVASSEAIDQYVVQHPEYFFGANPEHARLHADQPLVLLDHVRCAAFELPFSAGERFGPVEVDGFLDLLAEDAVVHREGERWEWIADSYPANAVNLRAVADGNFVVVDRTDGRQTIIAEVDYTAAALTLYEGAIHMVQSVPYQVERLDWPGRKAYVRRTFVDYYTDAIDHTKLKVLERFDASPLGAGQCETGEVHVVRRVSGYKKIRFHTHENIGYGPVQLPDQELQTTAAWWQLPPSVLEAAWPTREQALAAFHGAGNALHCVAQLAVMAEGRDLQKCVDDAHPDGRFHPALYLYDAYPGGIGLSQPLYERRAELVKRARGLVAACPCTRGCPACVGPVAAPVKDEPETPKRAAQRLLTLFEAA